MGASTVEASESLQHPTGHICSDCGENLNYNDEVWLLEVRQPQVFHGKVVQHKVIDEDDPQGDYLFDPYFFCFKCWETMYKGLKEDVEDEPPFADAMAVVECACCGSGVREWEYAGIFTLGELQPSKREPNGVRGANFVPIAPHDTLCTYCLVLLNDGYITMWDHFSQNNECSECTQLRCWREETCGCTCHTDQPGEDTE